MEKDNVEFKDQINELFSEFKKRKLKSDVSLPGLLVACLTLFEDEKFWVVEENLPKPSLVLASEVLNAFFRSKVFRKAIDLGICETLMPAFTKLLMRNISAVNLINKSLQETQTQGEIP